MKCGGNPAKTPASSKWRVTCMENSRRPAAAAQLIWRENVTMSKIKTYISPYLNYVCKVLEIIKCAVSADLQPTDM
jgi:hypothetical protein